MPRSVPFKFTGGRAIEAALSEIASFSTRRNTARRALERAAEPIRDEWARGVDKITGELEGSIAIGKAERKEERYNNKGDRVTAFVGVNLAANTRGSSKKTGKPILGVYAYVEEFGNEHHPANPAGRHAFETKKQAAVARLADDLWREIEATAARKARRLARQAAKG